MPILLPLLIGGAILLAGYDFYAQGLNGSVQSRVVSGAFATHQELGSLLLMILPSCVGLSLATLAPVLPEEENGVFIQRMATSGAALFLFLALLISRCRSAWLGAAVALLLGVVLCIWYSGKHVETSRKTKNTRNWFVIAVVPLFALLALLTFFSITQSGQALINRAATMSGWRDDLAMQDRFRFWEGGLRMAQERPWTGWGPGSYLVLQNHWTGIGYPKEDVLLHGANHGNIAHNYYAQWMADTGFTGLALHGILLVTFGIGVARRLGQLSGQRVAFYRVVPVIVGVATIAGTAVDAFSSPSYNFHPISLLWWIVFGVATSYTIDTKKNI